jgi:response regulator of citrate/malate metabolism
LKSLIKTILYIDDDSEDVEIFEEAINSVSPKTILYSAKNANEAYSLLETLPTKPNYIFLDLKLPRKNGKHILKDIKSSNALKHIPIIIISSLDEKSTIIECKNLGATDYIIKPTQFKKLCDALSKYL